MEKQAIKVTVFGASGFIGRGICNYLSEHGGYWVTAVERKSKVSRLGKNTEVVALNSPKLKQILAETQVVINLCGANIVDKSWTEDRKQELWDSRIGITEKIKADWIHALTQGEGSSDGGDILLLNASAVGYYNSEEEYTVPEVEDIKTETSEKGRGFLSDLTAAWEKSAHFTVEEEEVLDKVGIKPRSVQLRFGLVLGKEGGVLPRIMRATNWFAGAVIGSGEQLVSWIAIREIFDIVHFLITHPEVTGPVNLVAPQTVSFRKFTQEIGKQLKRPVWGRVPAFLIKKVLGERADLLLKGDRVYPEKLLEAGYVFKYPNLQITLEEMS